MKKIGFLTLLMTATLLFTLAFPAAAAGPKAPAAPRSPGRCSRQPPAGPGRRLPTGILTSMKLWKRCGPPSISWRLRITTSTVIVRSPSSTWTWPSTKLKSACR